MKTSYSSQPSLPREANASLPRAAKLLPFAAALAGAGAMYYFDPRLGHRRRMLLRDRAWHLVRIGTEFLNGAVQDVFNRTKGFALETTRAIREGAVQDDVLVARVRARLGRHASHTRLISVSAKDGEVTLAGAITMGERESALKAAYGTAGVKEVHDHLFEHASLDSVKRATDGETTPRHSAGSDPSAKLREESGRSRM